jgi:ribonuclease VapC
MSREHGRAVLESSLSGGIFEVAVVTSERAGLAVDAFRRLGKGRSPAAVNISDCFAFALAKSLDAPLLLKGADFAATDICVAAKGA